MNVSIKTLSGNSYTIKIYESDTYEDVRNKIEYKTGIFIKNYKIFSNGKHLIDDESIKSFIKELNPDSVIYLTHRTYGG